MTLNRVILCFSLLSLPIVAQAGDYSGGSGTPQSIREGNSHAQSLGTDQGSLGTPIFEQLDKNQDGKLTGNELKGYDSGPEGKIGKASVKKNRTLIKNHDLNGDGVITLEEFNKSNNVGQNQPQ